MAKIKREFIEVAPATKEAVVKAAKRQGMPVKQFSSALLEHALAELRAKDITIVAPPVTVTTITK